MRFLQGTSLEARWLGLPRFHHRATWLGNQDSIPTWAAKIPPAHWGRENVMNYINKSLKAKRTEQTGCRHKWRMGG